MTNRESDQIGLLLVADDHALLERIATGLGRHEEQFSIRTETSPPAARTALGSDDIDCIAVGLKPSENDATLFEAVRNSDRERPVVPWFEYGGEAVAVGSERIRASDGTNRYAALAEQILNCVEPDRSPYHGTDSERVYLLATEASTDAFFTLDVRSGVLRLRSGFEQFGYTRERLSDGIDWWFDRVHADDRERLREKHEALLEREARAFEDLDGDRGLFTDRFRWRRADGSYIHSLRRGILLFEDGDPTTIVGTVTNVTERVERERALAALNDVAVDLDDYETVEGLCERSIEASQDILQFDLSVIDIEEDGQLVKAAISEDIPRIHTVTMSVDEGIAGKTYRTGESVLIDDIDSYPEGDPAGPYRSAISIPIGDHGVFQAVAEESNVFDETDLDLAELLVSHLNSALDRLEREQQLRHQNERLEEFTRIVSHDLRNPLNVAMGSLNIAQDECDSEYLREAVESLSRMESILEETLTLAREGRIVDEMQPVALEAFVRDCWRTVATGSATLEVEADSTIRADPDRLRHVFENLFRNAVEHGAVRGRDESGERDGVSLTVRVGSLEEGFYVEDNGEGIPADDRETVFELGASSNGGSGFGLSIVRRIAEAHGWTVRVTDGEIGGARFEFSGVDGPNR